jgi:lysyl-tRNA synthetase class 1
MPDLAPAPLEITDDLVAAAEQSTAWPFEEARKLAARLKQLPGRSGPVLFETGYGPSGLPHIGTFGEVARTSMVRTAYRLLTRDGTPTRLMCFSDDLDGLRKVPDNVPQPEMIAKHLGQPLTAIPDPFGTHASFGEHNNARLRGFLDQFGFDYEFASATEYYRSGRFDPMLLRMLEAYDEVMAIMLPSLREERQQTYSPFLPVSPANGEVLQVPVLDRKLDAGTIVFRDPANGKLIEVPVTGGHVKCQWKADWALRWAALGVDYEMNGKDLIDSVKLSSAICKVLGGTPPEGFAYELFLDEAGQKISKSRGNGLTIDEWLRYASPESLSQFMFQKPRAAKKLSFDVIPRAVDDYYSFVAAYHRDIDDPRKRLGNAAWHIHGGAVPAVEMPVGFSMLLNLAAASNAHSPDVMWGFIQRHIPGASKQTQPELDRLVGYAVRYYQDFVEPTKRFRPADATEREALTALDAALLRLEAAGVRDAEAIQNAIYEVGRSFPRFQDRAKTAPDGRPGVSLTWFAALYEILLGLSRGPRFGSFVAIYGLPETRRLISQALEGRLTTPAEVRL